MPVRRNIPLALVLVLFSFQPLFAFQITKLGEWGGGRCLDVFVQGDFAYCASAGSGLEVFDVGDPLNPRLAGSADTLGLGSTAVAQTVFVEGELVYIITGVENFASVLQVFDISNPPSPTPYEMSFFDASDVHVIDNLAYIGRREEGFQIWDFADPANPEFKGSGGTDTVLRIFADEQFVYVIERVEESGELFLTIHDPRFSFSGLANPVEVNRFPISNGGDLLVVEGFVYVSGANGLEVMDSSGAEAASSRLKPRGSIGTAEPRSRLFSNGDLLFEAFSGGFFDPVHGLTIWDLSTPGSPVILEFFVPELGVASGFFAVGNRGYLAAASGGLQFLDISNPANPVGGPRLPSSGSLTDVYADAQRAYVTDSRFGLRVLDISDLSAPREIGGLAVDGPEACPASFTPQFRGVFVQDNIAYLTGRTGFEVYDVSVAANPACLGSAQDFGFDQGVQLIGHLAFSQSTFGPVSVVDVSDPQNMAVLTEIGESVADFQLDGDHLFLAGGEILSLADPSNPQMVSALSRSGDFIGVHNGKAVTLQTVALLDQLDLSLHDVQTAENPEQLVNLEIFSDNAFGLCTFAELVPHCFIIPSDLELYRDRAFVTSFAGGLLVYDFFFPEKPKEVARFVTPGEAGAVFVRDDGIVFVADNISGKLFILRMNPFISGSIHYSDGSPVPDVELTFMQAEGSGFEITLKETATDGEGTFEDWVDLGWGGTATPTLQGHTFEPPALTYQDLQADQRGQNFVANRIPSVDAGSDITIGWGQQVDLQGSVSDEDGDEICSTWAVTSQTAGAPAQLDSQTDCASGQAQPQARLTAPPQPDDRNITAAQLQVELETSDNRSPPVSDQILVEVVSCPGQVSRADLRILPAAGQPVISALDRLTYNFRVTNLAEFGNSDATGVIFAFEVPQGTAYLQGETEQGSCPQGGDATSVQCLLGTLGANSTVDVSITLKLSPDFTGRLALNADVSSQQCDPFSPNNMTTSRSEEVPPQTDLEVVSKQSAPANPSIGNLLNQSVSVFNRGPRSADNVALNISPPPDVQVVSVDSGTGTCQAASSGYRCTFLQLPAGRESLVHLSFQPSASGLLETGFSVSSNLDDWTPDNNQLEIEVEVGSKEDLAFPAALDPAVLGVAVVNSSSEENRVLMRLLNAQGQVAGEIPGIVLPPLGQAAQPIPDSGLGQTLLISSEGQAIQGFLSIFLNSLRKLDAVGGRLTDGRELYFPRALQNGSGRTVLFVYNPQENPTDVQLELFTPQGTLRGQVTRMLEPLGSFLGDLNTLFGPELAQSDGYIRLSSAPLPVRGVQIIEDNETLSAIAAQPTIFPGSRTLRAPHFFNLGDGATTFVRLLNLREEEVLVRAQVISDEGQQFTAEFPVSGHQLAIVDLAAEIQAPVGTLGHFELSFENSDENAGGEPQVVAIATYVGTQAQTRASLPLILNPQGQVLFQHVAQTEGIFHGLAILNPDGGDQAEVVLTAFDPTAQETAQKQIQLASGERLLGLLNQEVFFGSSFSQNGGYLLVQSDQPLVVFTIFGGAAYLAAIEGQYPIFSVSPASSLEEAR
ncbi:MAG TPA: hypothetical protein VLU25_05670 [Acidobacteriota bacterium]|nr:hypothetical protein [Acidobacteriota bacterium]